MRRGVPKTCPQPPDTPLAKQDPDHTPNNARIAAIEDVRPERGDV
jgi:hypothetical protein